MADDNTNAPPSQRLSISDFDLVRYTDVKPSRYEMVHFRRFIDPEDQGSFHTTWQAYEVRLATSQPRDGMGLCWYCVSTQFCAYVTVSVYLTVGEEPGAPRDTEMRYRDMIVDNYLAVGGNLATFRWYAAKTVVNTYARASIKQAFARAGRDFRDRGHLELLASSAHFDELTSSNPLVQCIISLCRKYSAETGNAKVRRCIFITDGYDWEWLDRMGIDPQLFDHSS